MGLREGSIRASDPPDTAERYGRYQIVCKLASGGMGEVFLAKSIGAAGFQKRVVIKRLLPHLLQHAHFVEGLVREAKLLLMLDHPNIVQVLDLGREGEDHFIAMEFVHGYNLATIAHYCAHRRMIIPADACCFIALQVLSGLEYAHDLTGVDGTRHYIVHRDVSPQNVLISRNGRVKLADFGIAKLLDEAEAELTNSLKGKFRYMAPEAVDGGRIDHRYDLFAVGILLFESLTRRHLFAGRRDVDILNQVRQARVPPLVRYHPGLAPAIVAVVERALMRNPDQRYQGAAEFSAELRAALPVHENEAERTLRSFVEDLYDAAGFPHNKPKLPDPDAVDPDVTRSLVLDSRVLPSRRSAADSSARVRGGRSVLLWAGLLLLGLPLVVLVSHALVTRQTDPPRPPVIIRVDRADAGSGQARQPAIDHGARTPNHGEPDQGTLEATSKRRPRVAPISFTTEIAKARFGKAGSQLRRCVDRFAEPAAPMIEIGVTSIIKASGRVTRVTIHPAENEGTPLGRCIKRVAMAVRYPRHDKPEVTFHQPLRVTRR